MTYVPRRMAIIGVLVVLAACTGTTSSSRDDTSSPAGSPPVGSSNPTSIKIAYDFPGVGMWPSFIAQEQGIFTKYGLDVEQTRVAEGPTIVSSLVAGQVTIGEVGTTVMLNSVSGGVDIKAFMSAGSKPTDRLISASDIAEVEDLRGKTVALREQKGQLDVLLEYALQQGGLTLDDVVIRQLGDESTRFAGLISHAVDATIVDNSLEDTIEEHGFNTLVNFATSGLDEQKGVFVASTSYLADHGEVIDAFMKAYMEGIQYFKQHRDESVDIMAKYMDTTDLAPIQATWDLYAAGWPDAPLVSVDGVEFVQSSSDSSEVLGLDPASTVDNSRLQAIQESGFLDTIGEQ